MLVKNADAEAPFADQVNQNLCGRQSLFIYIFNNTSGQCNVKLGFKNHCFKDLKILGKYLETNKMALNKKKICIKQCNGFP